MTNRSSRAPKSHSESWPRRRTRSEAYRAAAGSPAAHSGYTLNAWVKAEKDRGQKNNNDVTAQPAWTGGGPDVGSPRGCTAGFVSSPARSRQAQVSRSLRLSFTVACGAARYRAELKGR